MWDALLLVLLPLAGAIEPDPTDPIAPSVEEAPPPLVDESPEPCAWDPVTCPDSGVPPRPPKWTRYGASVLEITAINIGWNLLTAYAFGLGWAQVSGGSISANFDNGWFWDPDRFSTNFVAHPYHGAMLYGAARMNGLTYWEALPLVAFGSWEWEQFLETESPSINDQIMTTIGGMYFGEALWRISGTLLDDSARGAPRLGREFGALVFDPMRGLDRLLSGKAWRRGVARVPVPTAGQIGLGAQIVWQPERTSARMRLTGDLRYGDVLARNTLRRPMDAFDLHVELFASPDFEEMGVHMFSTGAIAGRRLPLGERAAGFLGVFHSYDYAEDPSFRVGGTSIGPGWWSRHPVGARAHLDVKVTLLATLLGGADSPYVKDDMERDYIYGQGAVAYGRLDLRHERLGSVFVETRWHWLDAMVEVDGDELVGLSRAGVTANFWRGWGLGAEAFWYDRHAWYAHHPDYTEHELRLQIHAVKSW